MNGNLTLAPGACLDAFTLGTVTVGGNLFVGQGATLALGCTPGSLGPPIPQPPCGTTTTTDSVGGSVIANQPLTMYLDGDTIWGSVISTGGGPGATFSPYINFPIKDNTIYGNVIVQGWQGAWFGFIRNTTHGSVILNNNVGVAIGEFGADSTEVVTNVISGNLICRELSGRASRRHRRQPQHRQRSEDRGVRRALTAPEPRRSAARRIREEHLRREGWKPLPHPSRPAHLRRAAAGSSARVTAA